MAATKGTQEASPSLLWEERLPTGILGQDRMDLLPQMRSYTH